MNRRLSMKKLATLTALTLCATACSSPSDPPPPDQGPGELLMSSLERNLAPTLAESTRAQLSADNRDFAFDLLHRVREEGDDNIFFSPHSISIALAMTYAGASGGTYDQMGALMRFTLAENLLHPGFNALDLELARRSEVEVTSGDAPQLHVVNAI
jgi:serpin B